MQKLVRDSLPSGFDTYPNQWRMSLVKPGCRLVSCGSPCIYWGFTVKILSCHCLTNFRFMTFVLFRHGQHLLLLLNGVRKPFLVRTHVKMSLQIVENVFKKTMLRVLPPTKINQVVWAQENNSRRKKNEGRLVGEIRSSLYTAALYYLNAGNRLGCCRLRKVVAENRE